MTTIMDAKKSDLIYLLRHFAKTGQTRGEYRSFVGDDLIATKFADFLEADASIREEIPGVRHAAYLPKYLVEAFDAWRTLPEHAAFCETYRGCVGADVPDLANIGVSNLLERGMMTHCLPRLFGALLDEEWVVEFIRSYLRSQDNVLSQVFQEFVRKVYRQGLYEQITAASARGMGGRFRETQLRSYVLAGRIMLTFAVKRPEGEYSVSFVGDESDPRGERFGLQSIDCGLPTALTLIWDVVALWPTTKTARAKCFRADKRIKLDAVVAMGG